VRKNGKSSLTAPTNLNEKAKFYARNLRRRPSGGSICKKRCRSNEPEAIKLLMSISHVRHWLPEPLRLSFEMDVDLSGRIALCTIEIPDFNTLQIVKQRKGLFDGGRSAC
jgi:hypothetical protein